CSTKGNKLWLNLFYELGFLNTALKTALLPFHSLLRSPERAGFNIAVRKTFAELSPSCLGCLENTEMLFPPNQRRDVRDERPSTGPEGFKSLHKSSNSASNSFRSSPGSTALAGKDSWRFAMG